MLTSDVRAAVKKTKVVNKLELPPRIYLVSQMGFMYMLVTIHSEEWKWQTDLIWTFSDYRPLILMWVQLQALAFSWVLLLFLFRSGYSPIAWPRLEQEQQHAATSH